MVYEIGDDTVALSNEVKHLYTHNNIVYLLRHIMMMQLIWRILPTICLYSEYIAHLLNLNQNYMASIRTLAHEVTSWRTRRSGVKATWIRDAINIG